MKTPRQVMDSFPLSLSLHCSNIRAYILALRKPPSSELLGSEGIPTILLSLSSPHSACFGNVMKICGRRLALRNDPEGQTDTFRYPKQQQPRTCQNCPQPIAHCRSHPDRHRAKQGQNVTSASVETEHKFCQADISLFFILFLLYCDCQELVWSQVVPKEYIVLGTVNK